MMRFIGKTIYFLLVLLGLIMLPIVLDSIAYVYPDTIVAKIINFIFNLI